MKDILKSKLIIIEDSAFSRVTLYNLLESIGYTRIDIPEDSAEGWDMIAQSLVEGEAYDLVITDLNMPGLDGMDLIEKIKSDPGSSHLKILVISADADKNIIDTALRLGAADYIVKPAEKHHLQKTIEKVFS
jgi:CheY-like chemotaxis protein